MTLAQDPDELDVIVDRPSDVSDWGDRPPMRYDGEDDGEALEQRRAHEARLRDEGVKLLTPTRR